MKTKTQPTMSAGAPLKERPDLVPEPKKTEIKRMDQGDRFARLGRRVFFVDKEPGDE